MVNKEEGWKKLLPIPKDYSIDSRNYPKWLRFEGICYHDDAFMCEHRIKYVYKVIRSLLTQTRKDERKRVIREIGKNVPSEYKMPVIHLGITPFVEEISLQIKEFGDMRYKQAENDILNLLTHTQKEKI